MTSNFGETPQAGGRSQKQLPCPSSFLDHPSRRKLGLPRGCRVMPVAAPRGAGLGSGIPQPPAAPTPPAGPLLPAGATLGRPPLEAGVRHLQRASCLPHRELQLRQLEASVGLNQTSCALPPPHAPQTRRGQAWKTATRGLLGGAPALSGADQILALGRRI